MGEWMDKRYLKSRSTITKVGLREEAEELQRKLAEAEQRADRAEAQTAEAVRECEKIAREGRLKYEAYNDDRLLIVGCDGAIRNRWPEYFGGGRVSNRSYLFRCLCGNDFETAECGPENPPECFICGREMQAIAESIT